jgi:hypothetical protein
MDDPLEYGPLPPNNLEEGWRLCIICGVAGDTPVVVE